MKSLRISCQLFYTTPEYGMSKSAYEAWKDKTLAYYASQGVEMSELEELDEGERIKRRAALLSGE